MTVYTRKTAKKSQYKAKAESKLSRTHLPDGLTTVKWQRGLRRQFGRVQQFKRSIRGQKNSFQILRLLIRAQTAVIG